MLDIYTDTLYNSPLFINIEKKDIRLILDCFKPTIKSYSKNEIIALSHGQMSGVCVVLSGNVSVIKEIVSGHQVILSKLSSGELFGETAIFSDLKIWPATVIANEPTTIMTLKKDQILGLCSNNCIGHKLLISNMISIIAKKAYMLNKRVEYLSTKSIRARICIFFIEKQIQANNNTFFLSMNRNELANFLGIARPSLSRELGKLRDEHIIDFYKNSIKIINLEELKKQAI